MKTVYIRGSQLSDSLEDARRCCVESAWHEILPYIEKSAYDGLEVSHNMWRARADGFEAKLKIAARIISHLLENGDSNNPFLFHEAGEFLKTATSAVIKK